MHPHTSSHITRRAVTAHSLRVAANPDGTRYVIAEGDHANVILTSDRRALRAHLHDMLNATAPTDAEKAVMRNELWHALLGIMAHTSATNEDYADDYPHENVAAAALIDIICDSHDTNGWFPATITAFDRHNTEVGSISAEDHLTDAQYDDLRDIGGPFHATWTLTLHRPAE